MTTHKCAREARVGDSIAALPRSTGFAEWNRFAAVNDEFVGIHMDDAEGRKAGYPGAIGMGRLQWSYMHNLLRQWLGGQGRIVSVSLQFRAPTLKGVVSTTKAQVTAIRHVGGEKVIDLKVWVEDCDGKVLVPGIATVAVPGIPDQP